MLTRIGEIAVTSGKGSDTWCPGLLGASARLTSVPGSLRETVILSRMGETTRTGGERRIGSCMKWVEGRLANAIYLE